MRFICNDPYLKHTRQILRHNQTATEKILWKYLRNQQFEDVKFFRQYSIGSYIIDFYTPKLRLAIEIDGGQHNKPEHMTSDNQRTNFLVAHNIKIMRFWNNEVNNDLEGVLERITEQIRILKSNSSQPSLIIREGGKKIPSLISEREG
ncbi:MAG: endonuclease domain-containing protein [Patescibacteria group bacterium]